MAKVALNGVAFTPSTASGHINYKTYDYDGESDPFCIARDEDGKCISYDTSSKYKWNNRTASSTITGTVKSSVTNVKINSKSPIVKGDSTVENETYNIGSGTYVSGKHSNASGSVEHGNSRNVFANGKSISIKGSAIKTHANTSTVITEPSSANVNIGT